MAFNQQWHSSTAPKTMAQRRRKRQLLLTGFFQKHKHPMDRAIGSRDRLGILLAAAGSVACQSRPLEPRSQEQGTFQDDRRVT